MRDLQHRGNDPKAQGRWQAQVRRRGMKPRCKSFDTKQEAEKSARDLEAQVDQFGTAPDTKIPESTTPGELLERYQQLSPTRRAPSSRLTYRTMIGLSQQRRSVPAPLLFSYVLIKTG